MRAIAYLRVSTAEQASNGLGLDAQKAAVLAEIRRRGWTLVETIEDAGYTSTHLRRPGITRALRRLRGGDADTIVVARLDRLSRSALDLLTLLDESERRSATGPRWSLVALDLGVDTSTPTGRCLFTMIGAVAELERGLIA